MTLQTSTVSSRKFETDRKANTIDIQQPLDLDDKKPDEKTGEVWDITAILRAKDDIDAGREELIPLEKIRSLNAI